jgi:hypothetical protein
MLNVGLSREKGTIYSSVEVWEKAWTSAHKNEAADDQNLVSTHSATEE